MLRNFISTQPFADILGQDDTLAVLQFEGEHSVCDTQRTLPTMRISSIGDSGDQPPCFEVWTVPDEKVEAGHSDGCDWRRSQSLQFVSVSAPLHDEDDFEQVAQSAYETLLDYIERSNHPQLVRFWNYIPNINHGTGDRENYKRFCTGRLNAFRKFHLDDLQFPAASAVGHYVEGITVFALTAAQQPEHHANPRQVDAFKYPRQYGISSPSFARATTINIDQQRLCFISGTASILGHSTVHKDDLRLQLYTTNDNILYLLKETDFKRESIKTLRVYLRDPADYQQCKNIVTELYPNTHMIFTHADICREDLLVEIECFCVADA